MKQADVTYICGPAGSGKTMLAEALRDYLLNKRTIYPRIKIIGGFGTKEIDSISGSATSGDWDYIIVDWDYSQPENLFPIKPLRVIRTDKA